MNYKLAGAQLYKQALGEPRSEEEILAKLERIHKPKTAPATPSLLRSGLTSAQKYLGSGVRNLAGTPGPLQKPTTAAMNWISEYPGAGHANPLAIAARQVGGKAFDLPVWNASSKDKFDMHLSLRNGKLQKTSPMEYRIDEFKRRPTDEALMRFMVPTPDIKPTIGQVITQAAISSPRYINNKLRLDAVNGGLSDHYDGDDHSLALPSRNSVIAAHELGHAADPALHPGDKPELVGPQLPAFPNNYDTRHENYARASILAEHGASERALQYLRSAGATPQELAASTTALSRAYDTYRSGYSFPKYPESKMPALFNQTPYDRAKVLFAGKDIPRQPMNQYPDSYPGGINDQKRLAAFNSQQKQLGKLAPGIVAAVDKQPSKWGQP